MATTTIRIEEALKTRLSAAADIAGKTAHAFILDAIAATVKQVEQEAEFQLVAEARWAELLADGKTVAWDDAKAWLESASRGECHSRPVPRTPKR